MISFKLDKPLLSRLIVDHIERTYPEIRNYDIIITAVWDGEKDPPEIFYTVEILNERNTGSSGDGEDYPPHELN